MEKSRLVCNLIILKRLQETIESYPDLRFGQILQILGINETVEVNGQLYIKDNFYTESSNIVSRLADYKIFQKNK